jgi:uridine kinase
MVVGIAGGTGAGKRCVSEARRLLVQRNGSVSILDQDSYYRDLSHLREIERQKVNFDDPAALDHDLLLAHLLDLIAGKAIRKPRYCFVSHTRLAAFDTISPASTVIVEGIFGLFDSRARSLMDYNVFVDVAADLRFIRRLRRDLEGRGRTVDSVITQYLTSVRPMHDLYIEPTKAFADVVLQNEGSLQQLAVAVQTCLKSLRQISVDCAGDPFFSTSRNPHPPDTLNELGGRP